MRSPPEIIARHVEATRQQTVALCRVGAGPPTHRRVHGAAPGGCAIADDVVVGTRVKAVRSDVIAASAQRLPGASLCRCSHLSCRCFDARADTPTRDRRTLIQRRSPCACIAYSPGMSGYLDGCNDIILGPSNHYKA